MNATKVMGTEGWNEKLNSHPHLIKEACKYLTFIWIGDVG